MTINDGKGLYDKYGMIDGIIERLNGLTVKGVDNMIIIIDCIQRLTAVKDGMRKEEHEAADNEQRQDI